MRALSHGVLALELGLLGILVAAALAFETPARAADDHRSATVAAVPSAQSVQSRHELTAHRQRRSDPQQRLQQIEVIGTAPLAGTGISRDKVPQNVQVLDARDLSRAGSPSLITALKDEVGGINVNDNLVDPFQPDILYRGFEASPVLGTPQGLAVYQNGVRINEAFGDTVNWDLVPDLAVQRVEISSSNPVYGLNALGGAVVLTMKNGFTYHGLEGEVAGGSFGQRSESLQYGGQWHGYSVYLAGRLFDEDGWRAFSPDHVQQLYADFGKRWSRGEAHVTFTGASNRLYGQSTTPAQELAIDRTRVFTTPQHNDNKLAFVTASGNYALTPTLELQGEAYRRAFNQGVANGNTTDYTACIDGSGDLCQPDGTTHLQQAGGAPIPDIFNGGMLPIGEDDREKIGTVSVGGTLQATEAADIFRHPNNFVFGTSVDHSNVEFRSSAEVGVINPQLVVLPSGYFVSTSENTPFNATPVGLHANTTALGVFFSDTFNLTPALAVTASGRYNNILVDLADQRGSALNGDNRYTRFNPALGLTYQLTPRLTAYAGYAEGNRAPTPGEIECSDPTAPCLLPSSLSSDPPNLKQVVSRTVEAGLRGRFAWSRLPAGHFVWNLSVYRTNLANDIYGVATSLSSGYFTNIGGTRRQGLEAGLTYAGQRWRVYGSYSLVNATFRSPFTESSSSNPMANAAGDITVEPGDRLPGIPEHQIKLGADYHVTTAWAIGGALSYCSDQFLRGDESNQNPPLRGYAVLNVHSTYQVVRHVQLFASIFNLLDNHYSTFGVYGDPTGVNAPGVPAGAVTNGPGVDNRFYGPAPPIAVYGGVRIRFK